MINPAVIWQRGIDGETLLLNPDTAAALALNASGHVVWQLLDGRHSVEQIVAAVRRHFRSVPDTVTADILALLDTLAEGGFIEFERKAGDELPDL